MKVTDKLGIVSAAKKKKKKHKTKNDKAICRKEEEKIKRLNKRQIWNAFLV